MPWFLLPVLYWVLLILWVVLYLQVPRPRVDLGSGPSLDVSIVVPTRNEIESVVPLLEGLLTQVPPPRDIIVVDDSDDGTPDLVGGFSNRGVRLLRPGPPPLGWVGKNHACHVGARAAQGAWLFFMDADTRLLCRHAVASALAHAEERGLAALSMYPRLVLQGFWARVVLPVFAALVGVLTGFSLQNRPWYPRRTLLGQFILIRRSAYETVGGHAGLRGAQPDDVALAARLRGHPWGIANGDRFYEARMYRGLGALVNGFSKNLVGGVGGPGLALLAVALCNLFLLAPGLALLGRAPDLAWFVAWGALFALCASALYASTRRGGNTMFHALLWPLAFLILDVVLVRALYWRLVRQDFAWKDRRYALADLT